jgi:hypothetical protein
MTSLIPTFCPFPSQKLIKTDNTFNSCSNTPPRRLLKQKVIIQIYTLYTKVMFITNTNHTLKRSSLRRVHADSQKSTDVSQEYIAYIFEKDKQSSVCHVFSHWFLAQLILWPWRWMPLSSSETLTDSMA